jgi:hypothetical protein
MSNVIKKDGALAPPSEHENVDFRSAILRIVQDKDIDPERLERFLNLQIMMEERQAKQAFQDALAGFQGDCPIIKKSKKVDFKSSNGNKVNYFYAPLDEIAHTAKPHLRKWGLSYNFNIKKTDDKVEHELVTTISHSAGHQESYSHFFNPVHDDNRMNLAQRKKSAISFAKRAGLENALGVVTAGEDDDARRLLDREITSEQLHDIRNLLMTTNTKMPEFLKFMGVEKLEDLSELEGKKAIHALKQKRAKGPRNGSKK